jgi:predicted small secreted protein
MKSSYRKKRAVAVACLAVAASFMLTGCAAVWGAPSDQAVFFDSTPLGAPVSIDGKQTCVTMCTQRLARKQSHTVAIARGGQADTTIQIRRRAITKWVLSDLTFGLVIGLVVDAATGKLYELSPTDVVVQGARP